MWKLIYNLSILGLLAACGKNIEIFSADDLNHFLPDKSTKTFFVKTKFMQKIHCQEIENWAKNQLPAESKEYQAYDFVEYDDELTLQGNPWLKKDAGAIVGSYLMCSMRSDKKNCYICHEK